jgi:hypothetical protein
MQELKLVKNLAFGDTARSQMDCSSRIECQSGEESSQTELDDARRHLLCM